MTEHSRFLTAFSMTGSSRSPTFSKPLVISLNGMKALSIKIIPMKRGHIPACEEIVAASEPWRTLREGIDFSSAIRQKQAHTAVIGGAVAGFVIFTAEPVFARGGYLRAIGVAPAIRGSGIGRKLLAFAEKTTSRKAQNLYLCVSSFNRDGRKFYRKCGYAKIGKIDGLIRKGASEFLYWRKLR
jgi:ribosomal protein S18 acetylase RimI-like enzyme